MNTCDAGCGTLQAAQDDWIDQGDDAVRTVLGGAMLTVTRTYYYAYDELGDDKLPTRCTGNKQCSVNENFEGWQAASSVMTCLDQAVPMRGGRRPSSRTCGKVVLRCVWVPTTGSSWTNSRSAPRASCGGKPSSTKRYEGQGVHDHPGGGRARRGRAKKAEDELVNGLATLVYYDGDAGFCDCATDGLISSTALTLTISGRLVREAHEACDALDQIDCAYLGAYADGS